MTNRSHGITAMCPDCGSADLAPIIYGLPDARLVDASDRGELIFGGCMFEPDSPIQRCRACGASFGRIGPAH